MIDLSQPVTNEDLVNSIAFFKREKSHIAETVLIEDIGKAHFLAPITVEIAPKDGETLDGSQIRFSTINNPDNEHLIIVFTDSEELAKWEGDKTKILVVTYDDLKNIALGAEANPMPEGTGKLRGFVLNHLGDSLEITPDVIRYFDQRKIAQMYSTATLTRGAAVYFGQPTSYPTGLVEVLSTFLSQHTEVKHAYMALIQKEEAGSRNLLLIIDSTGDNTVFFPQIASTIQQYLYQGDSLDIAPVDMPMVLDIVQATAPFYTKETPEETHLVENGGLVQ